MLSIWEIFKYLFDYTQSFITRKPMAVFFYTLLVIMVEVLNNVIPKNLVYISVFISILFTILSNAFLIKIGHLTFKNRELVSFEKALKESSILSFFTEHMPQALGFLLGNLLVFIIIFLGEALILNFSGFMNAYYNVKNHDVFDIKYTPAITLGVIFVLITLSIISYVAPYVYASVYVSKNFKEAFTRVFDLISLSVWKRCMNLQYFFDISMWFIYSTMVIVMIIPLMFYKIVSFFGLLIIVIYIIQFPMFSVMIRYWRE